MRLIDADNNDMVVRQLVEIAEYMEAKAKIEWIGKKEREVLLRWCNTAIIAAAHIQRKDAVKPGWISVKNGKPGKNGIYLARLSDGVYRILGYCNCTDGDMIWFEEGQENDLIEVTDVTHWLPLPEPPEEVQE